MTVKHEVKGQLAKLLATEDLIVESKKVETACFNVHTRVLTLPMWDKASNYVYDLLVGHEVGHALFTPDTDWMENLKIPHGVVNVVEDVRIEKLMKRKYAGLSKTWFENYHQLKEYYEMTGNTLVTRKYDHSLGIWVSNQRQNYKRNKLSQERIKLLEKIEFKWQLRN